MVVYIDENYKCHVTDDGNMTAVETDFFDGKCAAYIEGYRLIPVGATWTRSDGTAFVGEMIAPWRDMRELELVQARTDIDAMTADMAELVDMIYTNDMEVINNV